MTWNKHKIDVYHPLLVIGTKKLLKVTSWATLSWADLISFSCTMTTVCKNSIYMALRVFCSIIFTMCATSSSDTFWHSTRLFLKIAVSVATSSVWRQRDSWNFHCLISLICSAKQFPIYILRIHENSLELLWQKVLLSHNMLRMKF